MMNNSITALTLPTLCFVIRTMGLHHFFIVLALVYALRSVQVAASGFSPCEWLPVSSPEALVKDEITSGLVLLCIASHALDCFDLPSAPPNLAFCLPLAKHLDPFSILSHGNSSAWPPPLNCFNPTSMPK